MNQNTPEPQTTNKTSDVASPWQPLSRPLFRSLWIAALASNMATWMHDVGAAWLMTTLAPSPLMVSMVQASTSLPLFVLALPAGAFADVYDRRRLLLLTQGGMLLAAAGLAMFTAAGLTGPVLLLGFTFAIGVGTAFNAPAWQAILPEIVSREALPSAVALNSAGINLARAIGPALGGLIVAGLGPQAAFGLNAPYQRNMTKGQPWLPSSITSIRTKKPTFAVLCNYFGPVDFVMAPFNGIYSTIRMFMGAIWKYLWWRPGSITFGSMSV